MSTSVCPNHPGAPSFIRVVAKDSVSGESFDVVECATCGLVRTDPKPAAEHLGRYYPAGYHQSVKRYRFGLDRTLALIHRARIRRIEQLAGGPGRALDIGCGTGVLLAQMRRRGWQVRGTELSEQAASRAREQLGLDVSVEDLDTIIGEGATFDAVVLWHVAEHLPDPLKTFREIAQLLRPGGVLMVGVPNFGSTEAKFGGSGWFHLDVPRHLFHFTKTTLRRHLVDAGLVERAETHLAPEYDIFSFVQTVENRIGLPFNLLYDVLRRAEARLVDRRAGAARTLIAIAAAAPLAVAAAVWTPIAAAIGVSGTIAIYAQRPIVEENT